MFGGFFEGRTESAEPHAPAPTTAVFLNVAILERKDSVRASARELPSQRKRKRRKQDERVHYRKGDVLRPRFRIFNFFKHFQRIPHRGGKCNPIETRTSPRRKIISRTANSTAKTAKLFLCADESRLCFLSVRLCVLCCCTRARYEQDRFYRPTRAKVFSESKSRRC